MTPIEALRAIERCDDLHQARALAKTALRIFAKRMKNSHKFTSAEASAAAKLSHPRQQNLLTERRPYAQVREE